MFFQNYYWLIAMGILLLALLAAGGACGRELLKSRRFKEVGISALSLNTSKQATTAPGINLFDEEVLIERINKVDDYLVTAISNACREAAKQDKVLQVEMNTTGGDAVAAQTVAGILRHFRKEHGLRIVVMGKCYSAGVAILMAVDAEQRYAVAGSEFLIHASKRTATNGRDKRTRMIDGELQEIIANGSCIDHSSLGELLKSGKDCLFGTTEALNVGLVGAIL
jgi:ATP-dependent protease ClpP protease subunit